MLATQCFRWIISHDESSVEFYYWTHPTKLKYSPIKQGLSIRIQYSTVQPVFHHQTRFINRPQPVGCPDLHNIQPRELLFDTVMYGYHMDQNPKKNYSLNFEAAHRVFVKQLEMAKFTIEYSVFFKMVFQDKKISQNLCIFQYYMHDIPL